MLEGKPFTLWIMSLRMTMTKIIGPRWRCPFIMRTGMGHLWSISRTVISAYPQRSLTHSIHTMEQPEPHRTSSNVEAIVEAAPQRRPLLDRTFSDDAAEAPMNGAVSLVVLENEEEPYCRPVHLEQPDDTGTLPSVQRSSCGVSLPPTNKDPLTGITLNSRRLSTTSTEGTSNGCSSPVSSQLAIILTTTSMHRQESLPGSYAVRRGTSVHSSENNSEISSDEESSCCRNANDPEQATMEDSLTPPIEAVITTAKLVTSSTTLDESERQRIYHQAVQSVTSNAVVAQIVQTDKPPNEEAEHASPSSWAMNSTFKRSSWRRSLLLGLSCSLLAIGILLGVSTIPYAMKPSSPVLSPPSTTTTTATTSMIHDSTADPMLCPDQGIGCRAFVTTEELYQAIDAVDEVISYYADHPNNQTMLLHPAPVAIMYGYPMGRWNVSLLTNFSRAFDPWRHLPFNPDRAKEGNVTTTRRIATFFNEDLSDWDVSNADTLFGMFAGAASFQGRGLEQWDTSRVTNLSFVFMDVAAFNSDISRWNTSGAVTMEGMFQGACPFNRDISEWNVTQVTNMARMFYEAFEFSGDYLHRWTVSNVQNMRSMFEHACSFNGNISTWDTSRVDTMAQMVRLDLYTACTEGWLLTQFRFWYTLD
jgi:Mycoplasma protein of unknown function, DUF285